MPIVYIKNNSVFSQASKCYKKVNSVWTEMTQGEFLTYLQGGIVPIFNNISVSDRFEIGGPKTVVSESCQYVATINGTVLQSGVVWSITNGSNYATIDSHGVMTILSGASSSNVTVHAEYGGYVDNKTVNVTYLSGSTSETTTETIVDGSGNTTTTTTTVTENEDGTSSSESTSVVYNSDGEPVEKTNESVDTGGNVSTQEIEYNENGQEVVVSYTIDTTDNPAGEKTFNGDGVNTEYYAFDMTRGFEIDFAFTVDCSNKPTGQNENHHNILTMKRASPEPWYGFQLRQSGTNKYIALGTQFSGGTNTNTTLQPASITGNTAEYSLKIIYDPTSTGDTFVCKNTYNGADTVLYSSDKVFPDIEALRYLKVTIGYAMDANGEPFRYSSINVKNFSIRRLTMELVEPVITCDGLSVTVTCPTIGSDIFYRLNETGSFSAYTAPISITADTVVEAYSEMNGETSSTVTETCIYDDGIDEPVIYCDGEYITISCATGGAFIYYKITGMNSYLPYDSAIVITADTVCQAYSEIDGRQSQVVTENCVYDETLKAPIIECDGTVVTISCHTAGASIYYKLDDAVSFDAYVSTIPICANTMVYAYSTASGETSSTVSMNCIYNPNHDYSKDYLTLKVLSDGTIGWNSIGTGAAKTIYYSKNNGAWTTLSASSSTTISVLTGDVVRFKGTNTAYCSGNKANYSGFGSTEAGVGGGTSMFNVEGNVMSLVYGDNFDGQTALTGTYNFCQLFKCTHCVSAENLVLPTMTLTQYCYRAMFSRCGELVKVPALPATTLAKGCYWYMFEHSPSFTDAPDLPAQTLVKECYGHMLEQCTSLNYIKCMAVSGLTASSAKTDWVKTVSATGTFVKDSSISTTTWGRGNAGIPSGWVVFDDVAVIAPTITCDVNNNVSITSETQGASIYYKLYDDANYTLYATPVTITATTVVSAYSELSGEESRVVNTNCEYVSDVPLEASNRDLKKWNYSGTEITTPYSINAIDGHSASYAKGTFNFETTFVLRQVQPTYLWFQHADHSATVYIDNVLVEKHWGGYAAFFVDISNFVHTGTNTVKVAIKNNEGNNVAPASGDFNFNATLGNVKLFTSPCLPAMNYGYDGFHVTSQVTTSSATVNVRTSIPSGATAVCTIDDGTYHYSDTASTTGEEMVFTTTIQNPHLWNGKIDPHLYDITLDIYYNGDLYHTFTRPYGLRFYSYVINDTTVLPNNEPYTGFLLNGSPYLLRGCCMHDDIAGKANALDDTDYANTFATVQELGANFLRLAHYPHPRETYDWCDRLGIIVQTEGPCVNKMQSTMPSDYFEHLNGQYDDMVNQHYNHPCIMFWGLSNETTTDDKDFAKEKMNGYIARIKALDSERLVGYVMAQSPGTDPSAYYNNPNADWFGCNIYEGWYNNTNSNNPSTQINTRIKNVITNKSKALAYSEYGCGGTQHCHSDDYMTTTTRGNNPRHDIEYMMWLHEGHIAAIKNYPQLMFTSQWQLFDIAVANRNEGYTVCIDGENATTDDNLRRLNDKGLVERDHVTKKDPFYLYKAWWNPTPFVHICGKDYTKRTGRTIKCYTNDPNNGKLSLYVNNTFVEETTVTDNIATFTAYNFSSGDIVRVDGSGTSDTFTFA